MEETKNHILHPIVEVLTIAVIIFAVSLVVSWIINPFMVQLIHSAAWSITLISGVRSVLGMFLGGLVCFKLIERRPVHWGIILLISVVYRLLMWAPAMLVNIYAASFGEVMLAGYAKIHSFASPVLAAIAMVLVVRLLCAPKKEAAAGDPSVQIGLFGHVLLLLFTCGIWHLIWIYRTTRYLNCVEDEPYRNPATKLLLCLFVPFYSIYWVYKSAQRIDKLADTVDIVSDLAVVCLILEIFVPLIPPILMQDKINKIVEVSQ